MIVPAFETTRALASPCRHRCSPGPTRVI